MRLINVETLQMEEFFGDAIPKYAILSHTWGEEEVSFDDWHQPERAARMKGYAKIMGTCSFVSGITGLNYVWVDTACIDKRSSADLSEAINSMFHWYGSSQVCLVYLADVDAPDQWVDSAPLDVINGTAEPLTLSDRLRQQFRQSRWFTRGWTLQELLAPRHVLFLSRDWRLLGNVPWLVDDICEVTGIPDRFLTKDLKLSMASVAQRMSWAAGRQTTRVEDMAYCLLGLFNINMPLLYGEGPKAFWRLQAEIIKESYDHSIFSWQRDTDPESTVSSSEQNSYPILAPSPQCFRAQLRVVQARDHKERSHYTLTNSGLRITLPVLKTITPGLILGVLNCRASTLSTKKRVCLLLYSTNGDRYTRLASIPTELVTFSSVLPEARRKMYIASPDSLDMGNISSWAAFAMLDPVAATRPDIRSTPFVFLAFESGADEHAMRYLEPRLSWRRLPCPWTRPGLLELSSVGRGSVYGTILEFTDPKTSNKACIMIGRRPSEDDEQAREKRSTWYDAARDKKAKWFTSVLERAPFADETFEDILSWADKGKATPDLLGPRQKLGLKPYAEVQFPGWDVNMHWVPSGCPMIVLRIEAIFEEAKQT